MFEISFDHMEELCDKYQAEWKLQCAFSYPPKLPIAGWSKVKQSTWSQWSPPQNGQISAGHPGISAPTAGAAKLNLSI